MVFFFNFFGKLVEISLSHSHIQILGPVIVVPPPVNPRTRYAMDDNKAWERGLVGNPKANTLGNCRFVGSVTMCEFVSTQSYKVI